MLSVDGKVDAQPLYAVATRASRAPPMTSSSSRPSTTRSMPSTPHTGAALWQVSLLGSGETPERQPRLRPDHAGDRRHLDARSSTAARGPHGAIFLVAMSKDASSDYHQRLHALDLDTGAELLNGPMSINPHLFRAPRDGTTTFSPGQYEERAALLLGTRRSTRAGLRIATSSPIPAGSSASATSTLAQTAVLNVAPNSDAAARRSG